MNFDSGWQGERMQIRRHSKILYQCVPFPIDLYLKTNSKMFQTSLETGKDQRNVAHTKKQVDKALDSNITGIKRIQLGENRFLRF
jgi:hypothetical protein